MSIHTIVQKLETNQTAVMSQMNELSKKQTLNESAVADLASRVTCLEADVFSMKSETGGVEAAGAAGLIVQSHLKILEARCDDAES